MQATNADLIRLEQRFWQALVEEDAETAVGLLDEPAMMVSTHGAMTFKHDDYRRMVKEGSMVIKSYELGDMDVVFPNDDTAVLTYRVRQDLAQRGSAERITQHMADASVWTRKAGQWRCVMHTETPVEH
ncbi:MAG: nuclear transport factor 2 family protein [Rhizobacter sp.]|nr:nuclear transport factor 2 family protein [Rhizobacter sp.]